MRKRLNFRRIHVEHVYVEDKKVKAKTYRVRQFDTYVEVWEFAELVATFPKSSIVYRNASTPQDFIREYLKELKAQTEYLKSHGIAIGKPDGYNKNNQHPDFD